MRYRVAVLAVLLGAVHGLAFAGTNEVYKTMGRWWKIDTKDHLTTNGYGERPSRALYHGQMFYIPERSLSGTRPIYRNFHPLISDHMDSTIQGEGGYDFEFRHGYAFTSKRVGTDPIRRFFRLALNDHMLAFKGETPGGYAAEGNLGYGYARFRNKCEENLSTSAGGVTMKANKVSGGSISELWWNGKQFINNRDYGRQISIATNLHRIGERDNPTEGGSKYGCPGVTPASRAQGSPLLWSSVRNGRIQTLTAPLQWNPENFGGDRNSPVIWNGTIGKDVRLNYRGFPRRIYWKTQVDFPINQSHMDIEIATAYLRGEFNRFYSWVYDTGKPKAQKGGSLEQEFPVVGARCMEGGRLRPPKVGGVIIANASGTHALGAYRWAGAKTRFALCNFLFNSRTGKYDNAASKWAVLGNRRPANGVTKGLKTWDLYLVVGTLDEVEAEMEAMADARWKNTGW